MLINIYQPVMCKECELIRRYETLMEKVSMPAEDGAWARDFAVHALQNAPCTTVVIKAESLAWKTWQEAGWCWCIGRAGFVNKCYLVESYTGVQRLLMQVFRLENF